MIDWIRNTETGELFPVESDFDFEAPAHLEIPEYTTIDYDKTKEMTITELQNQLIAAQNHIEAIESEKTSDNNSVATVNEVSPEIVSSPEKTSSHNISSFIVFSVLLGLGFLFILGLKVYMLENNIEISIPNTSEQKSVDYELTIVPEIGSIPIYSSEQGTSLYLNPKEQEQPQEQQETEQEQSETNALQNSINFALRFLPIIITIFGVKLAISFLMGVMRGS